MTELDAWLREHAAGAEARRVARTFVWCRADEDVVVGYYSLAGHRLIRDDLPKSISRGSPTEVPAVLLARLAIDARLQGQGLGGALLADALRRVVAATDIVAAASSWLTRFTRTPGSTSITASVGYRARSVWSRRSAAWLQPSNPDE